MRPTNIEPHREVVQGRSISTLGVGGPCTAFYHVGSGSELVTLLRGAAWAPSAQPVVIGGGSNLLIADAGFEGSLIQFLNNRPHVELVPDWKQKRTFADMKVGVRSRFRSHVSGTDILINPLSGRVWVNGAVEWDALVEQVVAAGLSGIECISGVPGTVGGAIAQNAGAYGQEVGNVVRRVGLYDIVAGNHAQLSRRSCRFGYRSSVLKRVDRQRFVVVEAQLQLNPSSMTTCRYKDVASLLDYRHGSGPYPVAFVREAVLTTRSSKGMLLDSAQRSLGSFFVNPHLQGAEFELLVAAHPELEQVPKTRVGRDVRLPAGALIERAGFAKGYHRGPVGVSSKHALAIVNLGGATAAEVVGLAVDIRDAVESHFGVRLIPEPVMLGFTEDPFAVGA